MCRGPSDRPLTVNLGRLIPAYLATHVAPSAHRLPQPWSQRPRSRGRLTRRVPWRACRGIDTVPSVGLREYREREGKTLRDIAQETGVSLRSIWRLDKGLGVNLTTAARIVLALNGDVAFADLLPPDEAKLARAIRKAAL